MTRDFTSINAMRLASPDAAPPDAAAVEPRWRVALAFATVYIVWGTTYFAIGEVVQAVPPLLMTAGRFIVAGSILYTWRRLSGAPRPSTSQWKAATILSALLLLGGYGVSAWAQQHVPSGLTALLATATPLLMTMIDWMRPRGVRPSGPVFVGLALGIAGMVMLIDRSSLGISKQVPLGPTLAVFGASLAWSCGSVYSKHAQQAPDVFLAAGMQMLVGTLWLTAAAGAAGEFQRFSPEMLTTHAISAWIYLTVFGSVAAYSAYVYMLKVSTPARVSTYAYVNPAIAVFVGWMFGGEPVNARILLSAALLLSGVALITVWRGRRA